MAGPCSDWAIDTGCCTDWATVPAGVQATATTWATTILWAATGRRFSLCEQVVRPCGRTHLGSGAGCPPGGAWGYLWSGGTWFPYVGSDGLWRNCGCSGFCSCRPNCEVFLPGPVNSVSEVQVDGVVVGADNYRVDDWQWLVRTDGECWPECGDLNVDSGDGFFEVSYVKGEAPPDVLLAAAGMLACEYAKACQGNSDCRLPARMTNLTRQGVSIQTVSPDMLLMMGLTGIPEVDQVIRALNPNKLHGRPRIMAPELPRPRYTTTP